MFCRPTLGYFDARQFLVSTVGQIVIVLLSMNGWNDSVKNNKVTWEWNPKQVNYCKHMSSVYKTKLLKSSTKHKTYNGDSFTATNNSLNYYN